LGSWGGFFFFNGGSGWGRTTCATGDEATHGHIGDV
jgi:hypothetical protein